MTATAPPLPPIVELDRTLARIDALALRIASSRALGRNEAERHANLDDLQLPPSLREKYRRIADELTRDLDSCRRDLLHQEATE